MRRALLLSGVFLGFGLTVGGVVSYSAFVDNIANRVTERLVIQVEKNTSTLQNRTSERLIELNIASKEIAKLKNEAENQLNLARTELKRLGGATQGLEKLRSQYDSLQQAIGLLRRDVEAQATQSASRVKTLEHLAAQDRALQTQVASLQKHISTVFEAARRAQHDTQSLRTAIADSSIGKPAILSAQFDLQKGGKIQGVNFGEKPGRLYLQIGLSSLSSETLSGIDLRIKEKVGKATILVPFEEGFAEEPQAFSDLILVNEDSIAKWEDKLIVVELSPSVIARVKRAQTELEDSFKVHGGMRDSVRWRSHSQFQVQTIKDTKSEWYP